jgi:hypothetical protein
MSKTKFRLLLLLSVATTLAAIGAFFIPGGYSQELADAYANEPEPWLFRNMWLTLAVIIPLLAVGIASFIGLFFFKRWGRTASFYTTIIALGISLFCGPVLSSALESTLFEASTLSWGAILALAYFSPVADWLGPNNSFKPTPHRGVGHVPTLR